ncbi:phage integrase N-terminal SAM-like domain-containing protein [Pseudomonas sp. gcc21]|uniref:phage integrase N-terminal SAM-like domain-containing protein n=1 Tax=Pseudomonas sp. gcc21 TaxID=2726989 RepID=UPI002114717A|nr:phage integrase N-terminal SAM-like domain-containing protein [Pseudomonas sp. gcc21]
MLISIPLYAHTARGRYEHRPNHSSSSRPVPSRYSVTPLQHYSIRTEKSYWCWIRYFIRFHKLRYPLEMGPAEVNAFLSWLAVDRDVAAATQNQALNAIAFLYARVLHPAR